MGFLVFFAYEKLYDSKKTPVLALHRKSAVATCDHQWRRFRAAKFVSFGDHRAPPEDTGGKFFEN